MHRALRRLVTIASLVMAVPINDVAAAEPGLTDGQWSIVEIAGKRPGPAATMNFTRVRWLGINTSCGPLWGWYRRSEQTLRIHVTGSGRYDLSQASPCRGVDYQLQLGRVRSFEFEGDQLVLVGESGTAIARLIRK